MSAGLGIPLQEGKKQRTVYLTGGENRNECLAPRIP